MAKVELSVIFLSGGAGLAMGWAVLRPGPRRRQDQLTAAARRGVTLLFGAVPLLAIAGTLEGFLSPSAAPALLKFGVGIVTGAALYTYLFRGHSGDADGALRGPRSGRGRGPGHI